MARPRRRSPALLGLVALVALGACALGEVPEDAPDDASGDDALLPDDASVDDALILDDAPLPDAPLPDAPAPTDQPPPDDAPVVFDRPPTDAPIALPDVPSAVDARFDSAAPDVLMCAAGSTPCAGRCVLTRVDPTNCGGCGRACATGESCVDGVCASACATVRCGAACVDLARDPMHCGTCDQICTAGPRAVAACGAGRCGIVCDMGFRDCDGEAATGCEADLSTSLTSCGACGRVCAAPHGTPVCRAGACAVAACAAGFGDCNADASDGCEAALATTEAHCGACANACGAGQSCVAGACTTPVLESYDTGAWPWAPWTRGGGSSECTVSAACAHDGARGLVGSTSGSRWYYRADRTFGASGQRLSAWVRTGTPLGRVYLGFGASSAGAWSFAFAPNTSQVGFYAHPGWTFTQLSIASATFSANVWYRVELTFGAAGMVTARVYNAAGAVVVTHSVTIAGLPTGGVATYAFNTCADTITLQ